MALSNVQPLNYRHFRHILADSVEQLVEVLENHQLGGWCNALQRYQFEGIDYIAGQNIRMKFHQSLVTAGELAELIDVSNEILAWGNMSPINDQMENNLEESL